MYINVYIYACMHVCMYACMHTCIHACIHTYIQTCIHMYTCMYNCIQGTFCSSAMGTKYRVSILGIVSMVHG